MSKEWKTLKQIDGFAKNSTSIVKGRITTIDGKVYADVRVFLYGKPEDKRTSQGFSISVDKLGDLADLVARLQEAAEAHGKGDDHGD